MKIDVKFNTLFTDNHIETSVNEEELLLKALKRLEKNREISGSTYVTKNRLEDAAKKYVESEFSKGNIKLNAGDSEREITCTLPLKAIHVEHDDLFESCTYQRFNKVYVKGNMRLNFDSSISYSIFHLVVSEKGSNTEHDVPKKVIDNMHSSDFKNELLNLREMFG